MDRRDFIRTCCMAAISVNMQPFTSIALADTLNPIAKEASSVRGAAQKGYISPHKALFYTTSGDG
ncbi:MAG: hypothetical protein AAB296_02770, partial [Candidatus Desantisbacteria bacterium]